MRIKKSLLFDVSTLKYNKKKEDLFIDNMSETHYKDQLSLQQQRGLKTSN